MKFTVITCTYNSEKFLKKNIESVKAQSFRDFEHIFIDGNSTDKTLDIIKEYQKEFPSIVKFYQFEPKGISNAMNNGIKKAQGEFLIHMHSDDSFYDAKVLEDVNRFLGENKKLDWIYGLSNTVEEDGTRVMVYPNKSFFHFHNSESFIGSYFMKILRFVCHQTVFIRKSVFDEFGYFDETLKCGMDPDFWLRIRKGTKWSFFDRIICNYCVREDAQSSGVENQEVNKREMKIFRKRHMNFFERLFLKILDPIQRMRNKSIR